MDATAPQPRFALKLAFLLALSALLFGWQLGSSSVVSEEFRWAEIGREMRDTGNYFHPTINGQIYYDKPVGSYWFIVAASYFTGGVNEWAARLPAALAGVLGVLLIARMGRRIYGENAGLLGGAILATSFGYTFYSRRASADIETVTGVLAALSLYLGYRERGGPWVLPLWILMAATSQTKGLLGFALPIVVMGCDVIARSREDRSVRSIFRNGRWFFTPWTLLAAPLGIGAYLLPFVISMSQTGANDGLEMVWRENVKRFVNPHNHIGPVYLYAGAIFVLAMPWSAFLVPALMGKPRNDGERFLRVYFWAIFAFFTLSASRRSYYLIPVMPPLSLLLADLLLRAREELSANRRRLRDVGYGVFAAGVFFCGFGLLAPAWVLPAPYSELPPLPYRAAFALGWFISLGMLAASRYSGRRAIVLPFIAFALFFYGFGIAWPAFEELRTRKAFMQLIHEQQVGEALVLFHARDAVFDLGRTAPEYTDAAELLSVIRADKVDWILARRRYLEGVKLPAEAVAEERSQPWEPADQAGNKLVLMKVSRPERTLAR